MGVGCRVDGGEGGPVFNEHMFTLARVLNRDKKWISDYNIL